MLAQTNLQLYQQLASLGWSDTDLAVVRDAYTLAAELFAAHLRPNEKPFLCHLVGAASALARWGERNDMVLAGLLHSAYFLGDFADGERGATPRRREHVAARIGEPAEQLLVEYGRNKRYALDELTDHDAIALELADLLDELLDAGPAFAPQKSLVRLSSGSASTAAEQDQAILEIAERELGSEPACDLNNALTSWRTTLPPKCLVTKHRTSYRLASGPVALARNPVYREVIKIRSKLSRKRAA